MSLASIREQNKRTNSFISSKVENVEMAPEDVAKIKNEIFYKMVKPVNYKTFDKFINNTEYNN